MADGCRHPERRATLTGASTARVIPDVPTFAVDDGFLYRVPDGVDVGIGSIVRVPLGGRRVRGWVVGVGEPDRPGLRGLLGTSGGYRVFDRGLLDVIRWAAVHYVAPMASLIAKAAPPNLPKGAPPAPAPPSWPTLPAGLPEVAAAAAAGRRAPAVAWTGPGPWGEALAGLAGPVLAAGRSVLVVAATVVEAEALASDLGGRFGDRVGAAWSGRAAAEVTAAWVAMQHPGRLLVGTREAAFWPVAGLALAVVVGDGRRGLKDRATPTTHARDVLWRRSGVGRWPLVLCGPVPASEAVGRGAAIVQAAPRPWGLVEVVDRTEDPPGAGVLGSRVRAALHAVTGAGRRAFVFTDRRSPAVRCVGCRRLRVCPQCGARPGQAAACPRCGTGLGPCASCGVARFEPLGAAMDRVIAEAVRFLGDGRVGPAGSGLPVEVGTERDLPGLPTVDLAVVVDADGLLRAPNYRAVEDGFRLMARVVAAAGPGRGRRAMVQTADPAHPAIEALRRADPAGLIEAEVRTRAALGFPPHGELLVVEMEGAPAGADRALREAVAGRGSVLGPADRGGRVRWLVQGRELRQARLAMRGLVQDWRDAGARVRIDADPIDL